MPISRLTVAIIQSHDDDDITCDGVQELNGGKWRGWITFWKDNRPHISPLISTDFIYETKKEAVEDMVKLRQELREFKES